MCKGNEKMGHHIILPNSSYIPGSGVKLELTKRTYAYIWLRYIRICTCIHIPLHTRLHIHIHIHIHGGGSGLTHFKGGELLRHCGNCRSEQKHPTRGVLHWKVFGCEWTAKMRLLHHLTVTRKGHLLFESVSYVCAASEEKDHIYVRVINQGVRVIKYCVRVINIKPFLTVVTASGCEEKLFFSYAN